jgi:hypothetical protein
MDRQYTPGQIAALPPTSSNRGLLHALARFGEPAVQKAAREQIANWSKPNTPEPDAAA